MAAVHRHSSKRYRSSKDGGRIELPHEFCCPISNELMTYPVLLVETGQTYERGNIENWFNRGHNVCPLTAQNLSSLQLVPNWALKRLIDDWVVKHRVIPADQFQPDNQTTLQHLEPEESEQTPAVSPPKASEPSAASKPHASSFTGSSSEGQGAAASTAAAEAAAQGRWLQFELPSDMHAATPAMNSEVADTAPSDAAVPVDADIAYDKVTYPEVARQPGVAAHTDSSTEVPSAHAVPASSASSGGQTHLAPGKGDSGDYYPEVFDGSPQDKLDQVARILARLMSSSMQVDSFRTGSSYQLWQLRELAADSLCRQGILISGALPALIRLLELAQGAGPSQQGGKAEPAGAGSAEVAARTCGVLRRLAVEGESACLAVAREGGVQALVTLLDAPEGDCRHGAAMALCFLGWNSVEVKAEVFTRLLESAQARLRLANPLLPLARLLKAEDPAEAEAGACLVHMLTEALPPGAAAAMELPRTPIAPLLAALLAHSSSVARFAASRALKNLAGCGDSSRNTVEVVAAVCQSLVEGCAEGFAWEAAAGLLWELACPQGGVDAKVCNLIATTPHIPASLCHLLAKGSTGARAAALGLADLLTYEDASKPYSGLGGGPNLGLIDSVRSELAVPTFSETATPPVVPALVPLLLSQDHWSRTAAATLAANIAAHRSASSACAECRRQPQRVVQQGRFGLHRIMTHLNSQAQPLPPLVCRHSPRGAVADSDELLQGLLSLLDVPVSAEHAAAVSAAIAALHNLCATEEARDRLREAAAARGGPHVRNTLLELVGCASLSPRSRECARMVLVRLDAKTPPLQYSFITSFLPPSPPPAIYPQP